jgi:hypothetical protein
MLSWLPQVTKPSRAATAIDAGTRARHCASSPADSASAAAADPA